MIKSKWFSLILTFLFSVCVFGQTDTMSVDELESDLEKVDTKLEQTRARIQEIKDVRFLPDLYFMLAEFYVSKSRYQYQIKLKENEGVPLEEVDFTLEKKPKFKAIETYQSIVERFPKLKYADKALFYMAHEFRELGQFDQMIATYSRLTREYPKSEFYPESKIILGDYEFNTQKNIRKALGHFKDLLKRKTTAFTALASYRAGWCYINLRYFKNAFYAFEKVLTDYAELDLSELPDLYKKTDIKQDALLAMVWPYSEITRAEFIKMGKGRHEVIEYFRRLSPTLQMYLKVMSKLARRLVLKKRNTLATRVYFELLRLSPDLDSRVTFVPEVYKTFRNSQRDWPFYGFVREIAKTAIRARYSRVYTEQEKKKIDNDYEIFARDIATRLQKQARETGKEFDYLMAIAAYKSYLNAFDGSKYSAKVRLNLAESFFNIKDYINAGKEYGDLARRVNSSKMKKSLLKSSIESYSLALKATLDLSRLEITEAREGLRESGISFLKRFKKDNSTPSIILNLGQTYYDERSFDKAQKTFRAFIRLFPNNSSLSLVVNLLIDTYRQQEDIDGLIKQVKTLIKNKSIRIASVRNTLQQILQQAEIRKVQDDNDDPTEYGKNLLKLAQKYKGSEVGDKALFEAFQTFKAKKDQRAFAVGEKLLANHSKSKYAKEVVTQLGQLSLLNADLRRASLYFEVFYNKYPNDRQAKELLLTAAQFRKSLGDYRFAATNFKRLGQNNEVAESHYLAQDWSSLLRSATNVGGLKSVYWRGLAAYRLQKTREALPLLKKVSQSSSKSVEEKTMIAHSLYIVSLGTLREFDAVQIRRGNEAAAVNRKAQLLQELTQTFQKVIGLGDGTWTVASFYSLGQTYLNFAEFIANSPIPKGFPKKQVALYKRELKKQSSQYAEAAAGYFTQCIEVSRKYNIFTAFTKGCLSGGKKKVTEIEALGSPAKAGDLAIAEASRLRRSLLDKPRDIGTLIELSRVHVEAKDYQMGLAILDRALEIAPDNAKLLALKGVIYLYLNKFSDSHHFFQASLKKSSKSSTALWGMAALYQQFGQLKKAKQHVSKAKKISKKLDISHPYINSLK